jgi:hypothetical protein
MNRLLRPAAAIAALLLLASCAPARRIDYARGEVITVTGYAESRDLAVLEAGIAASSAVQRAQSVPVDPSWAQIELTASATGKPPSSFSNVETRRLMAKRSAIGQAWRRLGHEIEQVEIPGYKRVGRYCRNDEEVRGKIERVIQGARVIQEREHVDGSYDVILAVRLDALAQFLPPGDQPDSPADEASSWREAERQRLRVLVARSAEEDARHRVLGYIQGAPIGPGRLMGQAMLQDAQLAAQIQGMVRSAPIQQVRFGEGGACEADIQFDLGRPKRLVVAR